MKNYLNTTSLFSEMPMSEEEQHLSSTSISPIEGPALSYPSSESPYLMVSPNQPATYMSAATPFVGYFPPAQDYSSSSDSHHSLMYPHMGDPTFMHSGTSYSTTTPSPTSSISSGPLTSYSPTTVATPGANMYMRLPKDCMPYQDVGYFHHPGSNTTNSTSDGGNGPSSGFDTTPEDVKPFRTSPTDSCALLSNDMAGHNRSNSKSKHHKSHGTRESATNGRNNSKHTRCEKPKKRCSNCYCSQSPSWRRSVAKLTKGDLLCNACGLYEKTAKKKRMLVTHGDGNTKVIRKREAREYRCSICGVKDATRWRRFDEAVFCERCARQQAHPTTKA